MSQGCKNAKGADKASAVGNSNAYRLGSEQMIGMEARCADCWQPPAFPAARDVKPARGPMRETYANELLTLQNFGMRQIQHSHFCLRRLIAADARLPKDAYERASANGQPEELLEHTKDYESPK
jgi:hypothetical protein